MYSSAIQITEKPQNVFIVLPNKTRSVLQCADLPFVYYTLLHLTFFFNKKVNEP